MAGTKDGHNLQLSIMLTTQINSYIKSCSQLTVANSLSERLAYSKADVASFYAVNFVVAVQVFAFRTEYFAIA